MYMAELEERDLPISAPTNYISEQQHGKLTTDVEVHTHRSTTISVDSFAIIPTSVSQ